MSEVTYTAVVATAADVTEGGFCDVSVAENDYVDGVDGDGQDILEPVVSDRFVLPAQQLNARAAGFEQELVSAIDPSATYTVTLADEEEARYLADVVDMHGDGHTVTVGADGVTATFDGEALLVLEGFGEDDDGVFTNGFLWIGGTERRVTDVSDGSALNTAGEAADLVLVANGWTRTGEWFIADNAMYAPVEVS